MEQNQSEAADVADADEKKRIVKEALKEWLDEKFAAFGRWSAMTIGAAALAALLYFILRLNGWYK